MQSVGQSTAGFSRFLEAFNAGMSAGESSKKLQVIADLFYWYRQHGACMKLFGKQPTDREKILGEYCNCGNEHKDDSLLYRSYYRVPVIAAPHHGLVLARIPDYRSEFGISPQQAALIRDFIFGTGEIIGGILCYTAGKSPTTKSLGLSMLYSGVKTAWNAGNALVAQHYGALQELKTIMDRAEEVSK